MPTNTSIEKIQKLSGTYQEIFLKVQKKDIDFWSTVEDLIFAGWGISEFKHANIENIFNSSGNASGSGIDWDYIEKRCDSVESARESGFEWMGRIFDILDTEEERKPWHMIENKKRLISKLFNVGKNLPPMPIEYPETDAIYDGAWRRLVSQTATIIIEEYNNEAVMRISFESAVPGFRDAYPYGRLVPFKLINEKSGAHIGFFSSVEELYEHLDVLKRIERTYLNVNDRF